METPGGGDSGRIATPWPLGLQSVVYIEQDCKDHMWVSNAKGSDMKSLSCNEYR